jgi:hypothetical protein
LQKSARESTGSAIRDAGLPFSDSAFLMAVASLRSMAVLLALALA